MKMFGRPMKTGSVAVMLTAELYAKLSNAANLMDKYALSPTGQEVRVLIGDSMEVSKAIQSVLRGEDAKPEFRARIVRFIEGPQMVEVAS